MRRTWKSNGDRVVRIALLAGAGTLITAILVACPPTSSEPLIDTMPARETQPGRVAPVVPTTPIKMEKPRMLGPVAPAIVLLPASMGEPTIRVKLTGEQATAPKIVAGKYRGTVDIIKLDNGKFVAVNTLPMDSYLQGVLAKELYGSWSVETYKAQSIAARTYALFQICIGDAAARGWDVNNDESSQMYGGIAGESSKSRAAVAATRGMVLQTVHNGQTGIFCAFYSACAGTASQDPWEAWGDSPVEPLRARKLGETDQIAPEKYNWTGISIGKADIARCIQAWAVRNTIPYMMNLVGIASVTVGKRNAVTGRPTEFRLTDGRNRSVPIRAEEFRLALINDPAGAAPKPWSSHFDIQDAGDHIVLVNGHGYGHGIGLSQWGAEALARQGQGYGQILASYYPGATVRTAW